MTYFLALALDGLLAGALYSLIALAFVVVYKASRAINFALGEWAMFGSRLTAAGAHGLGLGTAGALAFACAGMAALALLFNRLVLERMAGRPLIALLMVTIGLGALMRGVAPAAFGGLPPAVALPIPSGVVAFAGVPLSSEKLAAAALATLGVGAIAAFFRFTRTGVALRALADDQHAAMAVGIDAGRHLAFVWALAGVISVFTGALWAAVAGGGFGMALIGLKVFPIVIVGGLDSIAGALVGGLLVGLLESLAGGYLDPLLGGGFGAIASYLAVIAMLLVRPQGLFGEPPAQRI